MPIEMKNGEVAIRDDDEYKEYVCVNIPTDAATAVSVDIDDMVEITIKGRVKGVHATKGETWGTPGDIRVEVESVTVDGRNAFEDLID